MSSDPHHTRRSSNPQSIPLQDLNRPPDHDDENGPARQHRRTLSDRGRNLLRTSLNRQYAPIAEVSPSPTRASDRPNPQVDTSQNQHQSAHVSDDGYSPIEDAGAFQAAIGFSAFPGMGFEGDTSPPFPTNASSDTLVQPYGGHPYLSREVSDETDSGYFPPGTYDDTARLTDSRNLQPISGAAVPASSPQERSSFQSVHFLTPEPVTPIKTSGDDLSSAEAATTRGRSPSSARLRSLSPGDVSPLHRAGTIVRNISQRVVNISSEPDVAERTMRRKSLRSNARLQEPPSFPALPEYGVPGTDGASSPITPVEKPPSPARAPPPKAPWKRPPNPLRGRSLGIFSADNKIRVKLCDLLVHPVTEPLLLVLIIFQTILLAVDAAPNVHENPRALVFGKTWIDVALLVLFIIYTIEIIVRIIVSGFIINPVEYSTINRQVGFREAVTSKARQFLGPQRQPSQKKPFDPNTDFQAPTVMRTFTSSNMMMSAPEGPGDARQQQRARLAYRAYLRHSFNRTDFLAVVSFWIALIISEAGVEEKHHIFIFRMLSCLRIIRLLNLTSGTSVSDCGQ